MKKCKNCKKPFQPINSLNRACSLPCAIKLSEQKEGKMILRQAQRQEVKEMAIRLKTLGDYKKELQTEINKLVRLIDEGCRCISCGTLEGQMQAGHFRSVGGWDNLRYHLHNIYLQCSTCNDPKRKGGNVIRYRENLVKLFGGDTMDFIDDLNVQYPSLKLMQHEVSEAIILAKQAVKEVTKLNKTGKLPRTIEQRIELRKKYNHLLYIYK
jgi:hypothetical protein